MNIEHYTRHVILKSNARETMKLKVIHLKLYNDEYFFDAAKSIKSWMMTKD